MHVTGRRLSVAILTSVVLAAAGCSGPSASVETETTPSAGTPSAAPSAAAVTTPRATPTTAPSGGPTADCRIFPASNVWHADVSKLPVRSDSAALVASIGTGNAVHADFGAGLWEGAPIGIPVTNVPKGTAAVKVTFDYADESDKGPYPVPRGAKIEGGANSDGDRHIILLDRPRCRAYELYAAYPAGGGAWRAGSGAVYDLRANRLRPRGWTSADAAGLSILAGLVRWEEVAAGRIDHAIRITAPRTRNTYIWPARHAASSASDPKLPPMGLRLRLKSSVDISGLPKQARIVAEAMKRYGVILADNGSAWYISGAPDEHWDNDALHALGQLRGGDFEAVNTAGLMVSADSAAARN